MRTLTAELLAAQKSASAVPYLKVVISDRIGGVRRLAWSRLYSGSEPDNYHAAAMPGDGSLCRCRIQGGQLYYQRVAAPAPGSNFGSWTVLNAAADAGVALCSDGSRVLLFYVGTNGTTLNVRESTDSGAGFGAAVAIATAPTSVGWLAADVKASGDAVLVYSVGAAVYTLKRTGGAWGSPSAWTNSIASVTGLACYYQDDFNVVVAGTDSAANAKVWTAVFGDGFSEPVGIWSVLREVALGSSGSGVSFRAPFLSQPDVYRLTFVEKYSGTQSYSRPYLSYSPPTVDFSSNLWREPVPFDLTGDFGLAVAFSGSAVWLATPSGVWRADFNVPSLDVTADVLEASTEDRPSDGRLRLFLRNDDGRYSALPSAVKLGAEVRLSPGYVTGAGAQASDGPAYWVEAIEHASGGGSATLVIEARDGWSLLEAWRARRQYAWSAGEKNVFNLLLFVFARAGLPFAGSGSSDASSDFYPAFTIHPGESGRTAVERLLAMVPDAVFFQNAFAFLKEPLAAESPVYAYGMDHALLDGRYRSVLPRANRVQLFGDGVFQERFDWPGIASVYDRLRQVRDLNLTTVTDADDRGDAELRREAVAASAGEIVAPVNCGQELYDVITVTDAGAGLSAAARRVLGIALHYDTRRRPLYQHRLTLGGV
ncbi:MAG: hypothetical protein HYS09_03830 [Chloroflexi bacterium]|nr:hypothetical protein [Chloroflexota bacterium]